MLHSTTLGWFLSRATSSRIACLCAASVSALIVSSENVLCGGAEYAGGQPAVDADGGDLVDDDDAVPVGVLEDLLGVRVVRRAERVRAQPLHELEVVDEVRVVVALATHGAVLVLAEPGEVEGAAVDQELGAADFDGAHAHGERIAVDDLAAHDRLGHELVEVGGARLPEPHTGDADRP